MRLEYLIFMWLIFKKRLFINIKLVNFCLMGGGYMLMVILFVKEK